MNTTSSNASRYPFWQVLVALVIGPIGIGVVVNVVASLVVALAIVSSRGESISIASVTNATQSLPAIATSLLITVLGFAGTPLVLAAVTRRPIAATTGLAKVPHPAVFLLAPIGILALGPTSDALVEFAKSVAPSFTFGALDQIEQIARAHSVFVLIPLLAVCPGFSEEMLFRGFIQRWIGKGALAIAVSAITFSAIHLDPHHVAGVLPLGFYLAWVADRTDSTWPTIVAHTANNAAAVIVTKFVDAPAVVEHATWPMIVTGWGVCLATIVVVARLAPRSPREYGLASPRGVADSAPTPP